MFCTNCGKLIEGVKYCSSCGTKSEYNEKSNKISEGDINGKEKEFLVNHTFKEILKNNIEEYCDRYHGTKKRMESERYIKTTNPLNAFRFIFFGIPMVVLGIFLSVGGILIGSVLGLFIYVFICSKSLAIENKKSIKVEKIDEITEKIFEYISNNNIFEDIVLDSYDDNSINVVFKNETYHKIIFNEENSTCNIYCGRCTRKQVIKSGFQHSTSKMFKNSVIVNPILKSYIEYVSINNIVRVN